MRAAGRLYTTLASNKIRTIINSINGLVVDISDTLNISIDGVYKPFLIQDGKVARIMSILSETQVLIDVDPGFVIGDCFTPWSSRFVSRTGDKVTALRDGDIVAGMDTDLYQIIAHHNHGVKTSVLALWQLGESKEPTSSRVVVYTPTSKFHLLPDSDPDIDITDEFTSNILDGISNRFTDESLREDIWATVSNYTRSLFIDTSSGWFGNLQINAQSNLEVANNSLNYIEIDLTGTAVSNTVGWNIGNLKIAEVTAANGIITNIKQVWVKNTPTQSTIGSQETWIVNQETLEGPDGSRQIFTLPNGQTFSNGKIKVYTNGLREYDITPISNNQFSICLPALLADDILRIDYAIIE